MEYAILSYMTTTNWFTTRNAHNGPQITTFDSDDKSDERLAEGMARLLDTLELGGRAAKTLAR